MKKVLTRIACLMLVVAGGLALTACGMNDFIMSNRTATIGEGESAVQYSNTSSFALNYKGDNHYEAKGEANQMTQEQADAFWKGEANAGDNFVVVSVKFDAGAKIIFGFDKEGANFENPDGTITKQQINGTEGDDILDIILRVKKDGEKTFKVVSTQKDKEAETYTIDFSKVDFKTAE